MSLWIYPGSFDPVTLGHMDIISRGASLCDELAVVVMINADKHTAFTLEERREMLREACRDLPNVRVDAYEGLEVNYFRDSGASAVLRGVRNTQDLVYEQEIDACNRRLCPGYETVLLPARAEYIAVSGVAVRAIGRFGGNLQSFLPACLIGRVEDRLRQ